MIHRIDEQQQEGGTHDGDLHAVFAAVGEQRDSQSAQLLQARMVARSRFSPLDELRLSRVPFVPSLWGIEEDPSAYSRGQERDESEEAAVE